MNEDDVGGRTAGIQLGFRRFSTVWNIVTIHRPYWWRTTHIRGCAQLVEDENWKTVTPKL